MLLNYSCRIYKSIIFFGSRPEIIHDEKQTKFVLYGIVQTRKEGIDEAWQQDMIIAGGRFWTPVCGSPRTDISGPTGARVAMFP
jgi:hypothetical protein